MKWRRNKELHIPKQGDWREECEHGTGCILWPSLIPAASSTGHIAVCAPVPGNGKGPHKTNCLRIHRVSDSGGGCDKC